MSLEIPFIIFVVFVVFLLVRNLTFSTGDAGERAVAGILTNLPKDQYFIINDLMIEKQNGHTTQIDHVVISPYGIFVIETKNITGYIYGSEYSKEWKRHWRGYMRGGFYGYNDMLFDNPVLQNGAHVKALYERLHNYCTKFIPIIAFSPKAVLKVNVQNIDVVYWSHVLDVIRRYKEEVMSVEQAQEIYNFLQALNIKDEKRRDSHAVRAQAYKTKYMNNQK